MRTSKWIGATLAALLVAVLAAPAVGAQPGVAEGRTQLRAAPLGGEEHAQDYLPAAIDLAEMRTELASALGASMGTTPVVLTTTSEDAATGVTASVQGLGYDADGDGVEDLVGARYDHGTGILTSFVWSGADGSELRSRVVDVGGDEPHLYLAVVTPDISGDGVPDEVRVVLAGYTQSTPCDPDDCEQTYTWHVQAVSGRDGDVAWSRVLDGYSRVESDGTTRTAETRNGDAYNFPQILVGGDHDGDGIPDVVVRERLARYVREGNKPSVTTGSATATIVGRDGATLAQLERELDLGLPELHRVGDAVGDSAHDYVWAARYRDVEREEHLRCPLPDPTGLLEQLGLCAMEAQQRTVNRVRVDAIDGATLTQAWTTVATDRNQGSNVSFPIVLGDHDLTGDGAADVVVGVWGGSLDTAGAHSGAHLFDGASGTLRWSRELPLFQRPEEVADVDGDGDLDLVFGGGAVTWWWRVGSEGMTSGSDIDFASTVVEGPSSDVVREHKDAIAVPFADWINSYAVRPGDLTGDGIPERGYGAAFGRRDTPEGPLRWESVARVFDGGLEQRTLLAFDSPGLRTWPEAHDLDGDGVREVLEHDQGDDQFGPTTLRAIDVTGTARWEYRDATAIDMVGGLDGSGADVVASHVLVDGSHHRSVIRRLDGADAAEVWVRVLE